jgi:polar amino acid transport system substrate-binding protein
MGFAMPSRRALAALLATCAALAAACGPSADQTRTDTGGIAAPPGLANPGRLTVALPSALPPYGFRGPRGDSEGFTVDLAAAMADRLGLRLQVVALDPQDLLAAARGREVDVVIGTTPLSNTTAPPPGFDLVPYLRGGTVLLVEQGSAFEPQHAAELCGHRVVVVAGTRQQAMLADTASGCGSAPPLLDLVPTNDAALRALHDHSAEVYVAASATAAYDKVKAPVMVTSDEFDNTELGLALRSDTGPTRDAITRAFYSVHSDGSYEVLTLKWGLEKDSL